MIDVAFNKDEVLLVASRGLEDRHGLWLWQNNRGNWAGRQIDSTKQLSSIAPHPHLPVVYGTGGVGEEGTLHAWRIDARGEARLSETSSEGAEPCDLEVDPSGRLLIATNYGSSSLALQPLDESGAFAGPISLLSLSGSGPEIERQEAAHPHQALFVGEKLVVIDLGADLVREFRLNFGQEEADLITQVRTTVVPAGTGPRHGVLLQDGRLAISGELGENLIIGQLGDEPQQWASVRSTRLTGPAKTRWRRNYPGDLRRSPDGRHVYLANRSYGTLATFDVSGPVPQLVAEQDTMVQWPQHILVRPAHLLIAGWDSSQVVAMPLSEGIPQASELLFQCEGAGWLHSHSFH